MSNHASAEKRNRQRLVRTERNRSVRTRIRNSLKKARAAIAAGDVAQAALPVKEASVALARAVTQGVLHQKTASRTISRINAALAKLG
jgi:small subunit ribosomal protein S20